MIGAGPVGMATAALLRLQGIAVRVIEKNDAPTPFSKAVGVHARTLESMHALGVTEQLLSQGHPMHSFRLVDSGQTIMRAKFTNISSAYSFVVGLPQSCTERTLLARLISLGGRVEWNTRLVSIAQLGDRNDATQAAQVHLQHADGSEELVSCNWLIGADGSRSAVREMAGIEFPGGDYGKSFILGDVKVEWAGPKYELQFFLSKHGYLLLVPMPNGLHRIIAQTDKVYEDFQGDEKPKATLAELQAIVDRQGPGNMRVHSPEWLTCAPFYHRRADTCLKGRTLLVGDAFHLFSPLGAQGLNTGFQDAFNLAWKLAYIEKGWAPVGLVDSYRREREAIAKLIATITSKTTDYITATAWHRRLMRRLMTRWYNPTPKVQEQLPRLLAGLMQAYDGAQASPKGVPQAGARVPHAWVPDVLGYKPLASQIHGTQFTLLLIVNRLDAQTMQQLQAFSSQHLPHMPYLRVKLVTREVEAIEQAIPAGIDVIEDRLSSVFEAFDVTERALVLVRPDGVTALSAHDWSLDAVSAYFNKAQFATLPAKTVAREELVCHDA
ncbi:FAD-dependent monooxygenase [Jeongeupia wiesaeckerbachi]|uniref:FAD-dependent monooxygenase n=1 Tax=Jeongeupia wiesaeckerbachi TaxID=3051218 RepID=UPI003D809CB7